jgi:hypothetical protein
MSAYGVELLEPLVSPEWAAEEAEMLAMKKLLSPADFSVWRVRNAESFHQIALAWWGAPLPPELR